MANKTSIEWTDYNWNFLRGCSRVSEGCRNCYAEGVAARFSGEGMPYEGLSKFVEHKPRWTGEISFHEDILLQPLRWTKPRKVFVNSMSDLFHEKVTDEMLDKAFAVMALTPQHTYQILTKRPERMREYFCKKSKLGPSVYCDIAWQASNISFDFYYKPKKDTPPEQETAMEIVTALDSQNLRPLPNVWLGVSVEDQKTADERIPLLLQTPAAVRWISAEPLLSKISLNALVSSAWSFRLDCLSGPTHLDWVVVGGESGPGARPCDIANIRSMVQQCKAAGVAVFVKQLGRGRVEYGKVHIQPDSSIPKQQAAAIQFLNSKGGDPSEWPEDLQVREYPEVPTATASQGNAAKPAR